MTVAVPTRTVSVQGTRILGSHADVTSPCRVSLDVIRGRGYMFYYKQRSLGVNIFATNCVILVRLIRRGSALLLQADPEPRIHGVTGFGFLRLDLQSDTEPYSTLWQED